MDFYAVLDQVLAILQSRGRVTYRALKRQFNLDDDFLDDLKAEIIKAQRLAVDEDGEVLVWIGSVATAAPLPAVTTAAEESERTPLSYTPRHLATKILQSKAALEGERKQVTVLFCDLANSTGLAERLGPEVMHAVLNQFFDLALDEVHRYEGTINQFLGDGFMALFGAPIAHEDHARRAVLAALGLQRRLHAYNADVTPQHGATLTIRMGLNTGLVVVGAIGDNLRMDYTAVGDTTNVAARLQQEAGPHQIVISEATQRLIAGYCTTRSLGAFTVKGKAEPMRAWEAITAQEARTRLEVEAKRGLTPFVGRERELQTLHERFAQVQAGHGQVVFLVGEAGLGKSRLLLEFRRQLAQDATWLEGHAMSFGQSMAFHPLIDLLKRNFRIEDSDPEGTVIEKIERGILRLGEDLRPILPYVCYLLSVGPGDTTLQNMDPQLRRAEILDALRRLLLRASEVRPQVVVFEDLHWMDKATEAFLLMTADSIPTRRVLCLFTYRPGYVSPFGERTYHTRFVLPTLSAAASIQMAQAMLATESLPKELEALIVRKAEGNPFFVEEVVKSFQEIGAIQRAGDQYVLTRPLDEIVVPDTIQDVLMARIDRLPEAPKKTLQHAAVIGREFTYRLLDRLEDIREHTAAYLQELKTIELIYEKSHFPELAYMFKHALTRDVSYNSLLEQRRRELHRLVGQAIEVLYADRLAEQYEVLAYHFARGEEWTKALDYLCKAAGKAAQAFAIREAVMLYEQAQEAADHLGGAVDAQTLMVIHQTKADFYFVQTNFERAQTEYERLFALAQQAKERVREGEALVGMGWTQLYAHDFDQALAYARQAITIAKDVNAKSIMAGAYLVTGNIHGITARLDQAKEELTQARTLSQMAGDVRHQSLALWFIGYLKRWEGEYEEAVRLQSEGLRIAREQNLLLPLLHNLFGLGLTLTDRGNYDEARQTFEEGLVLAEKVSNEVRHLRLLNSLGWLYSECGALDRALDLNQRGAKDARRWGDPEIIANAELNLADIFLLKGDLTLAQEFLNEISRLVQDPKTSDWMKWRYSMRLFACLGELWLVRGDLTKAQEYADQCLDIATRTNSRKYVVRGKRLRGEITLARRQWDAAEAWLRQALLLARTVGNPPQLWKTYLAMGRLHTETKRPELARASYQGARDVIYRIKVTLHNLDLLRSLEQSSLTQQIYALSEPS
jgi:predicted ATPase/class 3 adenylate cyclase